MAQLQSQPIVRGIEIKLEKYVYKTWWIFGWYEKVSSTHLENIIVIDTDRPISKIVFNGKDILLD